MALPDTLEVTCLGCGAVNVIAYPQDDSWEPILKKEGPFSTAVVVGWQITVRCTVCGQRSVFTKENN